MHEICRFLEIFMADLIAELWSRGGILNKECLRHGEWEIAWEFDGSDMVLGSWLIHPIDIVLRKYCELGSIQSEVGQL